MVNRETLTSEGLSHEPVEKWRWLASVGNHWQIGNRNEPQLSKYVIDEMEKMLHCRDPGYGFLTYKCPEWGASKTFRLLARAISARSMGRSTAVGGRFWERLSLPNDLPPSVKPESFLKQQLLLKASLYAGLSPRETS